MLYVSSRRFTVDGNKCNTDQDCISMMEQSEDQGKEQPSQDQQQDQDQGDQTTTQQDKQDKQQSGDQATSRDTKPQPQPENTQQRYAEDPKLLQAESERQFRCVEGKCQRRAVATIFGWHPFRNPARASNQRCTLDRQCPPGFKCSWLRGGRCHAD